MLIDPITDHTHSGVDSKRINPKDLLGFPIVTSAPSYDAPDGAIVLGLVGGTYKLYARINKTWKGVTLT